MLLDREYEVRIAIDHEVEAPEVIDPRLPCVVAFVVLLRMERVMHQILNKEVELLLRLLANHRRKFLILTQRALRQRELHAFCARGFLSARVSSFEFLNGPT